MGLLTGGGIYKGVGQDVGNQNYKGECGSLRLKTVPVLKGRGESSFQSLEEGAAFARAVVFSGGTWPSRGDPEFTLSSPSDLLLGLSVVKPQGKPEDKRAHR